jgi:hypothetical protein
LGGAIGITTSTGPINDRNGGVMAGTPRTLVRGDGGGVPPVA